MKVLDVKNPHYDIGGTISCEVLFEGNEEYWPFGASPDDTEEHGSKLYHDLKAGLYGEVGDIPQSEKDAAYINNLVSKGKSEITRLKRLVEEVEYGIVEDIEPSYKEQLKAWYVFRKEVIDFDPEKDTDMPKPPQFDKS